MKPQKDKSIYQFAMALFTGNSGVPKTKKQILPLRKPLIQGGHKKFMVDGNVIYALNEENARKKFKKEFLYFPSEVEVIG